MLLPFHNDSPSFLLLFMISFTDIAIIFSRSSTRFPSVFNIATCLAVASLAKSTSPAFAFSPVHRHPHIAIPSSLSGLGLCLLTLPPPRKRRQVCHLLTIKTKQKEISCNPASVPREYQFQDSFTPHPTPEPILSIPRIPKASSPSSSSSIPFRVSFFEYSSMPQ